MGRLAKIIFVLCLCGVVSSEIVFGLLADQTADLIERAEKSVVKIEVTSAQGIMLGSGFVVDSSGIVITNCHVIENGTSAVAVFSNGQRVTVEGIRGLDENRDIAIIRLVGTGHSPLSLARETPRKGSIVMALGAPEGLSFSVTRGIVSAIRSAEEMKRELHRGEYEGTWIQVDAAISQGNSGGPIIDEMGNVVAMSTLTHRRAQNVNFGISAIEIQEFIDSTASKPWQTLSLGASVTSGNSRSSSGSKSDYRENFDEMVNSIPDQAIQDFAKEIESFIPKYKKDIQQKLTELKSFVRDLNDSEVDSSVSWKSNSISTRTTMLPSGKLVNRIYFSSIDAKHRKIDEAKEMVKDIEAVVATGKVKTLNGWKTILCLVGPTLDVNRTNTVGIVRDARWMRQVGDVFVVTFDRSFAVLVTQDSKKLGAMDTKLAAFIGYTLRKDSISTTQGLMNLEVICQIPDSKLQKALFSSGSSESNPSTSKNPPQNSMTAPKSPIKNGEVDAIADELFGSESSTASGNDGYREWNDRSGKFAIVAKMVSSTETHLTLRKKDGKILTVERLKLSDADHRYLRSK